MNNLADKIQSLRQTMGGSYTKPSIERLNELCENLKNNRDAFDYLTITRGINENTIDNFKLGYDIEKNAISIPIFKRGELVNIKYRNLDPESKSKYTQEKGCEVWIYNEDGISRGQEKGGVLIVEGEFDLMSCWQAGLKNVISPASGKDSYGVWLELLDTIPKVFIAYDNDKPGKKASIEMSERIGTDKSFEVLYPEGIKDANEYFKKYNVNDYKSLIAHAKPYYKYTYQGLDSVIESIKNKGEKRLNLDCLPFVKLDEDWMVIVSGRSGIGKTSYVMNIAKELMDKNIPTLVLPFERGIRTVGGRFLQVKFNKTEDELIAYDDSDWMELLPKVMDLPLYFALPHSNEVREIVEKAKRLFGIKVVIVDHLDYSIVTDKNEVSEMKRVLQEWKTICLENNIIFIIVHHVNKDRDGKGSASKKLKIEDLKGGSASYQVPEAVVLLSSPDKDKIEIDIVKNKGVESSRIFKFVQGTGFIGEDITDTIPEKFNPYSLDEF